MTSYPQFEKLEITAYDAIMELLKKNSGNRIEVVDHWVDDGLQCIDVKFTTWKLVHPAKCSFRGLTLEELGAFFYTDSPKAIKVLQNLFEARCPK